MRAHGRMMQLQCRCADTGVLASGHDSRVIGAIALMFHERSAALRRLGQLAPPVEAASLDLALWMRKNPPQEVVQKQATFMWWTAIDYRYRR